MGGPAYIGDGFVDNIAFGKQLRIARKERGMTSKELAELSGINANYLRQIESGMRTTSIPKMIEICRILHVSPDFLFRGEVEFPEQDEFERIIAKIRYLSPKQKKLVCSTIEAMIENMY